MNNNQGLSLIEVLFALFFITSTAIGFMSEQSHIAFATRQNITVLEKSIQLENVYEQNLQTRFHAPKPVSL